MSSDENSSYDDISLFDIKIQQFYTAQFWIFLLLLIPSMICSLFGLYHFLRDRTLRQALNNHTIIILLVINLIFECIDISWFIHFFRTFQSFSPSPTLRFIFGYIDWTSSIVQTFLYSWIAIERHILIFHDHLLSTKTKRIIFHYIPPIAIILYCLLYYAVIFFGSSCENQFDYLILPSFFPCAFMNNELSMYETIAHGILPVFIIVISSFVLLFRVIWQRYRVHQQIHWRRYRKMTIQVLSLSTIFLVFPFPYVLLTLLHLIGMSYDIGAEFLSYWVFCVYYALLFFPITAVGSLPELRTKLNKIVHIRRQRIAVGPSTINAGRMVDNRVIVQ